MVNIIVVLWLESINYVTNFSGTTKSWLSYNSGDAIREWGLSIDYLIVTSAELTNYLSNYHKWL